MDTRKAKILGKVQGVGFRYTALHFARKLNLTGSVRNLPDGSVEIIVQGPKGTIEQLFSLLQASFTIHTIEQQESAEHIHYSDFQITL